MKKLLFLLLITPFVAQSQNVWNQCNAIISITPSPSYDSTFVLSSPSRSALSNGMANWVPASSGGAASYLVYTANLDFAGGAADPTPVVFENTLGGPIVWTWEGTGEFAGTLSGMFPTPSKVWFQMNLANNMESYKANLYNSGTDVIYIENMNYSGTFQNPDASSLYRIEIRVYP